MHTKTVRLSLRSIRSIFMAFSAVRFFNLLSGEDTDRQTTPQLYQLGAGGERLRSILKTPLKAMQESEMLRRRTNTR